MEKKKSKQSDKSIFAGRKISGSIPDLNNSDKIDKNLTKGKTIYMGPKPEEEKIPVGKVPPKLEQKSYEDITVTSVVELPNNQVRPVNGRIFVIAVDPSEMKTESGIILPSSYQKETAKGSQKRQLLRYFVIDVADDCTIRFKKASNLDSGKIERGDEVFPFIPVEAVDFEFPEVHDFYNHQNYTVLHETELGGVGVSSLISKE